jgi:hypothetical protein
MTLLRFLSQEAAKQVFLSTITIYIRENVSRFQPTYARTQNSVSRQPMRESQGTLVVSSQMQVPNGLFY